MQKTLQQTFNIAEIARLTHVGYGTAKKWLTKGLLRSYLIPGTEHRRVHRRDLIPFLRANNLPMGELAYEEIEESEETPADSVTHGE